MSRPSHPVPRHRRRPVASTASLIALAAVGVGCGGGESAQEAMLERMIENETGGEVDLDLDGDGSFTLKTEEGEISVDVDGDGNVEIVTPEGDATFSAEDGEMTFDSDEGSGSIQVDAGTDGDGRLTVTSDGQTVAEVDVDQDGSFTISDEDGETVVGDVDADGGFTVVDEDGVTTFDSAGGIPDAWPDDVPRPEGLADADGLVLDGDAGAAITVSGTVADGAAWLEAYSASVLAAGFESIGSFSQDEGGYFGATRANRVVTASWTTEGDGSLVTVLLADE